MELTFANIALIVASSQAFLLALLIFLKHRSLFANRFLAALMLSYTVILLHLIIQDAGLYQSFLLAYIIVGVPLVASPLQYLYTKYLIRRSTEFHRKDWIHFLPFIVLEMTLIILMGFNIVDFTVVVSSSPATTPAEFQYFNWLIIAQGLAYMLSGLRLIIYYNHHVKDIASSIDQIQMTWLRNITLAGISAWTLFFIEDLLLVNGINVSNYVFVSVVFAVYVYAMGVFGLIKTEIFSSPDVRKTMDRVSELVDSDIASGQKKYERSGLTDEAAEQHLRSLLALVEEKKLYRRSILTLTELAEELSLSPHNLSEVINTKLHKNFYDFINGYRMEEVKKDLADPSKQHLKILSLAFDAGFNSKATFNTLFKEQMNMTPTEYRKSLSLSGDAAGEN